MISCDTDPAIKIIKIKKNIKIIHIAQCFPKWAERLQCCDSGTQVFPISHFPGVLCGSGCGSGRFSPFPSGWSSMWLWMPLFTYIPSEMEISWKYQLLLSDQPKQLRSNSTKPEVVTIETCLIRKQNRFSIGLYY